MSEFLDRISKLSPQRMALLADELNERVQAAERKRRVPLAIVGMGCRFPGGVHGPEQFWDLLRDGVDAIGEVPLSRWDTRKFYDRNPATPGKMATKWGGFLDEPEQFDPKFFGIAPMEAASMDPQQRLLLETAWETLEHAGIAATHLAGTKTGVFVGICNGDYSQVALNSPREEISPYFAPGLSHAVAAGRISYVLGLHGPSLAVDTSCSSSLVAVHLACQSLRLGECDAALAGGVNLMLNPDITIALSQSRMMASDGRCKAFSDSADGFVRGEGCGMIMLKRLPDAIRDRNRILAVIRGSACNQDGRSSGLTAPNGPSQESVVAAALADAGMNPDAVDYVEAHGTGTSLGDPIELGALNNVFAARSKASGPLFVGSVKTNLGHLESAAGIAGLMKLVLSIQHEKIPASLHLGTPNTRIEWERLPIQVPTEIQEWRRRGTGRVGGVSSFGFSGTNAHVIVEEYVEEEQSISAVPPSAKAIAQTHYFPLSAKTDTALKAVASDLHRHLLTHPTLPLADIARTLQEGRSHFDCCAGLIAASHPELLEQLLDLASGNASAAIESGHIAGHSPRIAFIFGDGHSGLQAAAPGLRESSPVFREALQQCEQIVQDEMGESLSYSLPAATAGPSSHEADDLSGWHGRAAAFALRYALAELWRCCGVEPAAVFGHGSGEMVAAAIAGAVTLRDGLRVAIADGHEMRTKLDELVVGIQFVDPRIPWISNSAGLGSQIVGADFATYWRRGSRSSATSDEAIALLAKESCVANLYLGDDRATEQFVRLVGNNLTGKCLASLGQRGREELQFLRTAAALYVLGCEVQAVGFAWNAAAGIVSLPTYPFERERYWLDPATDSDSEREADEQGLVRNGHRRLRPGDQDRRSSDSHRAEREQENWVYELVWEPKPLKDTSRLSTVKLDDDLLAGYAVTPASRELLRVEQLMRGLVPVHATYILRAFEKAGLSPLPTSSFTLEQLAQTMKIVPSRLRVLNRLIAILVEDGIVERTGDGFRFVDFAPRPDADDELQALGVEFPECRTEIKILQRCGNKLAAVLQGTYDPMQLVFADGSIDEAEQIYEHSPVCRFFNDKSARVVAAAVESIVDRPARILEIGGGTGATTTSIQRMLEGKRFEYCFTDISPVFLSRARSKFADVHSMSYRVLNIENDPGGQGFDGGSYDIIIAANVLHATADLRRTIAHVRTMLAPGGILVLVEGVRPDRWLDLTFGLTDGWWRFVDFDLRPQHPLVSSERWAQLLHEAGLSSCRTISYAKDDGATSQQTIIVAQADAEQKTSEVSSRNTVRHWTILADELGVGAALHTLLIGNGESCELVRRPTSRGEITAKFRSLQANRVQAVSQEIVYLWGMDVTDPIDSSAGLALGEELCGKTLVQLIQALLTSTDRNSHLWIATRGAQAAGRFSPSVGGALQSLEWGIGRTVGLEVPGQYRGMIDLDPKLTPEAAAKNLLAELRVTDGEDQIAYRNGERLAARLQRSSLKDSSTDAQVGIRKDGSYLIAGGLGGVGLLVAKWAAEQGASHLVLLGRTGTGGDAGSFAAERQKVIRKIEALGSKVTVVVGDVASIRDMTALFQRFGREFPPLHGIFHAATVVNPTKLFDLTEETIDGMLRPKVLGTWMLHELTKDLDLDFFLVFSSAASLLGTQGLAHYAAANQFQDSLAHYRHGLGLPMLSINWGAWETVRLVGPDEQSRFAKAGWLTMPSQTLFNMFPALIASSRAQVMIGNMDWDILKQVFEAQRARPLLEGFDTGHAGPNRASAVFTSLATHLRRESAMTPEERHQSMETFVREQAAQVLGFRRGELPSVNVPLMDLGLDSLMAVDLKNRLQAGVGQQLSPTLVFDHPSITAIVGLLETMLWAAHGSLESELATTGRDEIRI